MALTPRLELRQGQSLVMTPQLQQAIKLLQLSNLELSAFVEEELQKNPLLERDDGGPALEGEGPQQASAPEADFAPLDAKLSEDAPRDAAAECDTDYENVYGEDGHGDAARSSGAEPMAPQDWSRAGAGGRMDGELPDFEATLAGAVSLHDHLTEQMQVAISDPGDRLIAAFLIDMVDEAGYLTGDLDEASVKLGISRFHVERVLCTLQTFEPTGVCARNLADCLAIQLREQDRYDPAMQALIANLDLLAKRDMQGLLRVTQVAAEDLADMIKEIRALNPKPGLAFGGDPIQPVVPDVFIRESSDGGWHVELNTETLPRVLVNARYYAKVSQKTQKREDKAYLTECLNTANWLVKSLDQRARTILKVASEIVRQQDGFLAKGVSHLRPLNLRAVADAISMHESTVSRVTSNKYIATPRGLFEMKYFFTSAIAATGGGEAHSAEAVRHKIKDLIDAEAGGDVLSDDRIVELLKQAGIDIARRTVAKYREAMRIPSSFERRRRSKSA